MGLWDSVPTDYKKGTVKTNSVPQDFKFLGDSTLGRMWRGESLIDAPQIQGMAQTSPLNYSDTYSPVQASGAGSISNGLWNNGVGVQNPLSVGYAPTQVDAVAKAPIGAGNMPTQPSTPVPTLYASNQASNANGAPTISNTTMSSPIQEATNPMDMSMSNAYNKASFDADPRTGLYSQGTLMNGSTTSTPYSFMDNFTDFSSKDAAKNSLGNIATGVNVAGGLFDAYTKYQAQKAQADYQNRIAGLYEKQYADTEARRANAQANYDASVSK